MQAHPAGSYDRGMNRFRIAGLDPAPFVHLYGLSDAELAGHNARRFIVDEVPGFPDRVEMRDLETGERALLVNYTHLDVASPYRASHAIYVREGATTPYEAIDEIPAVLSRRLLSVRAFDAEGMMRDADVIPGSDLRTCIERIFDSAEIAFIDVHNAKPGCFAARVHRV